MNFSAVSSEYTGQKQRGNPGVTGFVDSAFTADERIQTWHVYRRLVVYGGQLVSPARLNLSSVLPLRVPDSWLVDWCAVRYDAHHCGWLFGK